MTDMSRLMTDDMTEVPTLINISAEVEMDRYGQIYTHDAIQTVHKSGPSSQEDLTSCPQ